MLVFPILERAARLALHRRGIRSRYVETQAGRVHVYDGPGKGTLPTIVLLHGIGSAAAPYADVLLRLRKHARRIVAVEHPGHGFSADSPQPLTPAFLLSAVTSVLQEVVAERFVLIGHSLGGAMALGYASRHPGTLEALVLVSPAGARTTEADLQALVHAFQTRSAKEARHLLERLYHRPPWFVPLLGREFLQSLSRPAVRELLASAKVEDGLSAEELARLTMPIFVVWGRSERLLPPSHLAYFREHLPANAVIREPYGFGHCPHLDDPAALASTILRFLSAVPSCMPS